MNLKQRLALAKAVRRAAKCISPAIADVLEDRALLSAAGVEPIGGTGNNAAHPTWGAAGTDLIRITPAEFANGINTPSLPQNPSARIVSNIVNSQADPANPSENLATVNKRSLTDFAYTFGQFMDHDMDLTQGNGAADNIAVPPGDPIGGPDGTPLAFNKSQTDPATGTSTGNPAQDVNSISSYLDLSQVYGSDQATSDALRTHVGGQMKTSPGGLPPLFNSTYFTPAELAALNASVGGMADGGPAPVSQLFATGDTRGNENVELTALQALFLDNHNRIAALLQKQNPTWTDQQLFDEARKLNIAQYQSIVYNEYIPAILGANALPAYRGYNPDVNAAISNEFSTVAFRFGHSLLDAEIERQGNDGQEVAPAIPLSEDFFDPTILNGQGMPAAIDPVTGLATTDIGAILKANADGIAQGEDVQIINEVRNQLFNEVIPGVGFGQDLIALDIQRGRDNGIGSYNQLRQALGLAPVTSFAQITSNVAVQQKLQTAYGSVDNIDAIEGGMAEDPVAGSGVGPLFQKIMVDQFTRLRDGDRFFYLNQTFTPAERAILNQGNTLAKMIEANTTVTNLQGNVFVLQASIGGTVHTSVGRLTLGVPGVTVELKNGDGNVVATTTTDRFGRYNFNQFSGPAASPEDGPGVNATGIYSVDLVLPEWLTQTTPNPDGILISRGGQHVTGINFGIALNRKGFNPADLAKASPNPSNASLAAINPAPAAGTQAATIIPTATPTPATSPATAPALNDLLSFFRSLPGGGSLGSGENTHGGGGTRHDSLDAAFHADAFPTLANQLK